MKDLAIEHSPSYFHHYIHLVEDGEIKGLLENGGIQFFTNQFKDLKAIGSKTYAENKWTINGIVQHLIDTERIFINRALRFVRQDVTDLPGYDHDAYVTVSRADDKLLEDLLEEYKALRKSSVLFFNSLNKEELLRKGKANGLEISVLSIAYILIGHPMHHFNVIRERYFGL